jgi:MtrB/PioB family decaheme-associated outer membrane protein
MMRRSILISLTAALVGAGPAAAFAQEPEAPVTRARIDFGVRGTNLDGDGARYERYRDLGDGLFLERFQWSRETSRWLLDLTGDHAGRRDQRFTLDATSPGRLKLRARWDQIPMLLSGSTRTLFADDTPGVLTIDDAFQAQTQANSSALAAIVGTNARTFDLETKRSIADVSASFIATPELTLYGTLRHTDRNGAIPYGGSFGHGSLVETMAPVDHRLTDVDAGAEFSRGRLLARGGMTASLFHNEHTTLAFDSPFRLTDSASASSRGRLSLAPSNSYVTVNGMASVRLPRRSRATAYVSIGSLKDAGDALMPQTINSANSPAPLERTVVDGEARTTAVNLTFTSRPTRLVGLDVRFRTYEYDNRTPEFAMTQRISYDNAPSNLAAPVHTEPHGVTRHTFDADLNLTPIARTSAGVGFSSVVEDRTHRIFESTTDYGTRLWFDAVGNQSFTLRTKYEHRRRRSDADLAVVAEELLSIGEQPGMRHFDVAERDRDRVTLSAAVFPIADVALNLSVAAGKDDYIASQFGLRDNTHRVYTAGFDATPTEQLTYGASYSYEKYNALSRSRQANPGAQFDDPARNWATDATDRVHSFILNAGIAQIADRVDVNVNYDFNRARSTYDYITGAVLDRTLPEEVVVDTVLDPPTALPPTLSELHRATTDVIIRVNTRLSLGLSHWFERYDVEDFTLDADSNSDLVRRNVLLIGYLYRPYTASTFWGRVIVSWR